MQIQVNTDGNIVAREELTRRVEEHLATTLARFDHHVTRLEVHLAIEASGRSTGDDKRCTLEARPAGQPAVAVTHHAADLDDACSGAAHKLKHLLDSRFGRQSDHKGGETIRTGEPR
jgi:sigma 54 modulation/S30EA-like ribosomal protein